MISTLDALTDGATELTTDQIDATGGLILPIPWCFLFPEVCFSWLY